jgi:lipase chaperone LimK
MEESKAEKAAVEQTYHSKLLDMAKAWLSVATVVGGALWGLYVYVANEKKAEAIRLEQARTIEAERVAQAERDNATRRIEAQKPFLQQQFSTYLKTTALVGRIIQLQPDDDEYKALRKEFGALYWAELALVEDPNVSSAMVQLEDALVLKEKKTGAESGPKNAALGLAHAMRDSIRSGWQGTAPNAGGNQK